MRKIRNCRKAQQHWEKLRKYVRYAWTSSTLNSYRSETNESSCTGIMMNPFHRRGSSHTRKLSNSVDMVMFSNKARLPSEKKSVPEHLGTVDVKSYSTEAEINMKDRSSFSEEDPVCTLEVYNLEKMDLAFVTYCQEQVLPFTSIADLPVIPPFEVRSPNEIDITDLQKNLQNLYEYNDY